MQKILITGGAGFIGSGLANRLADYCEVVCIDNLHSGSWGKLNNAIEKINADISELSVKEIAILMQDVDIVFHLAALKLNSPGVSSNDILQVNVLGSQKVYEAAGLAKVKCVIFSSSLYVYGIMGPNQMVESQSPHPNTIYGISKLCGEFQLETMSKKYKYRAISARLFFVYGPGQFDIGGYKSVIVKSCEAFASGKNATIIGDGKQELDYIYIDDCVSALIKLSESDYEGIVNIASNKPISVKEIVSTIGKFAGTEAIDFAPPDWTAGSKRFGSNKLLMSLVDWEPRTSIEDGLNSTWNYYSKGSV